MSNLVVENTITHACLALGSVIFETSTAKMSDKFSLNRLWSSSSCNMRGMKSDHVLSPVKSSRSTLILMRWRPVLVAEAKASSTVSSTALCLQQTVCDVSTCLNTASTGSGWRGERDVAGGDWEGAGARAAVAAMNAATKRSASTGVRPRLKAKN